jgi:hypothetical protein
LVILVSFGQYLKTALYSILAGFSAMLPALKLPEKIQPVNLMILNVVWWIYTSISKQAPAPNMHQNKKEGFSD